ncbi:MAG TPA: hypothetical protein VH597_02075 [Verrucomicrobiae bacterium]|jgi:hypothetical protein|nr:hypothetical protein [Verrucomicrobiae bacterium]
MNKRALKFSLLGLLAIIMTGTPVALRAQTTNAMPRMAAHRVLPFHGKIKTVDNSAKTISVGEMTLQITSASKILKTGKPATFQDAAVGDNVAGSYRKNTDGKMDVVSLRIGPKIPTTDSTTKTNTP